MQKIFYLAVFLMFYSCNDNASNEEPVAEDSVIEEPVFANPEDKLPWKSDFDSVTGDFVLKRQREADADQLIAANMINDINAAWDGIKLEFRKISNDTLYVAIPESRYLTQQMGSAGASGYIASVTYNLTKLRNIRFVNYDFQEGDHLGPGTFSRSDFKNYR